MTLRDKIAKRAEPIIKKFNHLFGTGLQLDEDAHDQCDLQNAIIQKLIEYDKHTETLLEQKLLSFGIAEKRLDLREKVNNKLDVAVPLQQEMKTGSFACLTEMNDSMPYFREELMKLDPNLITEEKANDIMLDLETKLAHFESNIRPLQKQLETCRKHSTELESMYKSTLN